MKKVYKIRDCIGGDLIGYFTENGFRKWLKETNEYNDVEEKEEDFYFKEIIIIDLRRKNEK